MRKILLGCVLSVVCVFVSVGPAWAIDFEQVPTRNLHVTWIEPSVNNDGSPLTDLAKMVVQLTVEGVAQPEAEADVSGPTGGQPGFHTFLSVCEPDAMPNVEVRVWAVDLAGNRSIGTVGLLTVDCLAPGPVE